MLTGGCRCGAVRYVVEAAPLHATICHCTDCRRSVGAADVAWFSVARAALRFTAGAPKHFASSPGVARGFCGDCGTSLTYARADLPEEIDVTTASLDDAEAVPPTDQTHAASGLRWNRTRDRLPVFPAERPPDP